MPPDQPPLQERADQPAGRAATQDAQEVRPREQPPPFLRAVVPLVDVCVERDHGAEDGRGEDAAAEVGGRPRDDGGQGQADRRQAPGRRQHGRNGSGERSQGRRDERGEEIPEAVSGHEQSFFERARVQVPDGQEDEERAEAGIEQAGRNRAAFFEGVGAARSFIHPVLSRRVCASRVFVPPVQLSNCHSRAETPTPSRESPVGRCPPASPRRRTASTACPVSQVLSLSAGMFAGAGWVCTEGWHVNSARLGIFGPLPGQFPPW